MKQKLTCEGGHEWERESQRGRPPTRCPDWPKCGESSPGVTLSMPPITHEAECEPHITGQMTIDEAIETGIEAEAKLNPFIERAKHKEQLDRMAKMRDRKTEIKVEREQEREESEKAELEALPAKIQKADQEYTEALQAASKSQEYKAELWDRADKKMSALLGLLNRQKTLRERYDIPTVQEEPVRIGQAQTTTGEEQCPTPITE